MRSERVDFGFGTGEAGVLVIGRDSLENADIREILEKLVLLCEFNQKKKVIDPIAQLLQLNNLRVSYKEEPYIRKIQKKHNRELCTGLSTLYILD